MDISLGDLNKLPIKKLKEILKKLIKEPKSTPNEAATDITRNLIKDKKRKGTILHPEFVKGKDGIIRAAKCKPVHLN